MTRLFIYLLLLGVVLYLLWSWGRGGAGQPFGSRFPKARKKMRGKRDPREVWMQVYETASMDEARMLQARFQEQELECIVYEQGKKDIHGNSLTGVGIAVPKSSGPQAQNIITRLPV